MTVSAPSIRPFQPLDLPALQHIRQAAFEPVFRSFREIVGAEIADVAFTHAEAEQAKLLDDICAAGCGHHVFVVMVGGDIVGFVSFTTDAERRVGEIGLNAVHPDHAGRGLGTWMYQHVMARMKELGMALATVSTGGDPSHGPRATRLREGWFRTCASIHPSVQADLSSDVASQDAHVLGMRRSDALGKRTPAAA